MSVNKVLLLGRLGKDPELRHTQGGAAVANFSIATNESFTGRDGEKQERTEWHRIVVWGKLAETCAEHLTKGHKVYIEGQIRSRSWQDNEGQMKYATEIFAQAIEFLSHEQRGKSEEDFQNSPRQGQQGREPSRSLGHSHSRERGVADHRMGLSRDGGANRGRSREVRNSSGYSQRR